MTRALRLGLDRAVFTFLGKTAQWLGWCLLLLSWVSGLEVQPVGAQSITPTPDGTGTVVTPRGNQISITGGQRSRDGANLFHSFTDFGLSQNQVATFLSNPQIQNILARVNGGNPSVINGLLQVAGGNSNLFLMNPAGIVFGSGASLNVPAAFTATTANGIGLGGNWFSATGANNYATLVGNPNAFAFTMSQPGAIANFGNLSVGVGQNLMLLGGGSVLNTGQLSAPGGQIMVAAIPGTNTVRVSQPGSLLSLIVEASPVGSQPNSWTLPVRSLPELLTGGGAIGANNVVVNPDGTIQLTGSTVRIPTDPGTTILAGRVNAANPNPGGIGGGVTVLGDKVGAINGNIDVSGTNGGGTIRIGGDYQGKGTIPNASQTFISQGSIFKADALNSGDGGKVTVWADKSNHFLGNITARGGLNAGNGGFVEVSGLQFLDFQGTVDTSAPKGNFGTLLLDPTNITVVAAGGTATALTDVTNILAPDLGPNASTTINAALLNAANTNVTLQATNDITFNAPVAIATPGVGLTAQANNSILVNANITTRGGNIVLNSDRDGSGAGLIQVNGAAISSNGGNITLGGGADPLTNPAIGLNNPTPNPAILNSRVGVHIADSQIDAGTGNIVINGQGNFSATAPSQNGYGIQITASTLQVAGAGNINLTGTGLFDRDRIGTNSGIDFINSTIRQVDGTGSITLTGIANNNNVGIQLGFDETPTSSTSLIESTGKGSISLNGISDRNNENSSAIAVSPNTSSVISSRDGNIILAGNSRSTIRGTIESIGSGSITVTDSGLGGIFLQNTPGAKITTNGGNITFNADASPLSITNTTITANGGNFTGTGVGNTAGFGASNAPPTGVGVSISGSTIDVGGGGITLTGTGSSTAASNTGIGIGGQSVLQATGAGSITLTGIAGAGAGGNNNGIQIDDSSVQSMGTGSITLDGTAGNGGISNHGIQILGSINSPQRIHISSVDGNIFLKGTGGTGGNGTTGNVGVFLRDLGRVESTGKGNITLVGDGGSGTSSHGIEIGQTNGNAGVRSSNGNITLRGKAENGAGAGVVIYSLGPTGSFVESTGAGNVVLEGTSTAYLGTLIQGTAGASGISRVGAAIGDVSIAGTSGNGYSGIQVSNGAIASNGNTGNLTLTGDTIFENPFTLQANQITIGDIRSAGQPISLISKGNLTTGNLDTSSTTGNGGAIALRSNKGGVFTGNLNSSGTSGGATSIIARTAVSTGAINSSGTVGNGGNVLIDPIGNVQVASINTQGATTGGNVDITAGQFFRATGAFLDRNSTLASISTAGGLSGGAVTIRHDGGSRGTPFIVGQPSENGTFRAITTGRSNMIATGTFLESYRQGTPPSQIQILTNNPTSPATPPIPPSLLTTLLIPSPPPAAPIIPSTSSAAPIIPSPPEIHNERSNFGNVSSKSCEACVAVDRIEDSFTSQYDTYLGKKTPTKSIEQIQQDLNEIELRTGEKPAIIYALFTSIDRGSTEDSNKSRTQWVFSGGRELSHIGCNPSDNSNSCQLSLVLVTAKGDPVFLRSPNSPRLSVIRAAKSFYELIKSKTPPSQNKDSDYKEQAEKFYTWLIQPLEAELKDKGINNLVFVLDEQLRTLPLAAIHLPATPNSEPKIYLSTSNISSGPPLLTQPTNTPTPDRLVPVPQRPRFLVDQYSVGMVPSMSLFDTHYVSLQGLAALVVGNSEFTNQPGLGKVDSLPYVPLEVTLIRTIYPDGELLLDDPTLNKQTIEQQRQSYKLVHLATHGFFERGDRTHSYLRLGNSKLTIDDIAQFRWKQPPVELLVLSACKTAVGDQQAELGFGGLSVHAGVRTAIASLWQVDDASTAALMAEFYLQLGKKVPTRAEALRRAQTALLDGTWKQDFQQLLDSARAKQTLTPKMLERANQLLKQDFSHPYSWAGLTMIGYPW